MCGETIEVHALVRYGKKCCTEKEGVLWYKTPTLPAEILEGTTERNNLYGALQREWITIISSDKSRSVRTDISYSLSI